LTAPAEPAATATDESSGFRDLLGTEERNRSTDDVLAQAMPLLKQVLEVHDRGLVAPLEGVTELRALRGRLWFHNAKCQPARRAPLRIRALEDEPSLALAVVARTRAVDDGRGLASREDLSIGELGSQLVRPVYLPGYVSWEHEVEHHDPVTDIFVLGLVLASLAIDLDLADRDHLARFVEARRDLLRLNPRIHPVVARAIEQMTELDRRRRPQDLRSLIETLEHYRDQEARAEINLEEIRGLVERTHASRRGVISERLRSRLFDLSRRNRLLYFQTSGQSLDLTEVSVPLVLDVKNISPDTLFTCRPQMIADLGKLKPLSLGQYVRFEDYPFAIPALDKLRTTAARASAEYGFSSLKLAICFLHWHDLKKAPDERIHSPLLLVPVELVRKKGVRDSYVLTATSELAEVNPVLRHVLAQLYGVRLPEAVDLTENGSIEALYDALVEQVRASEPAVAIERIDKPAIELVQARVRRRLDAFRKRTVLSGRGVRAKDGLEYSYRRDNFQPLGLRLFTLRVAPSESPAATMFDKPRPRTTAIAPSESVREIEKELYSLRKGGNEGGRYRWGFDLTCVTLGNFDYQKMSLVRDYDTLLTNEQANKPFDRLFSADARPVLGSPPPIPVDDQFTVVAADATQTATIAQARTGESFIIQGPPGTGKSQTITNLIADNVARGKRVLFVCEKRAAIDVVYHRLRQLGLDRLTAIIHDSQADKKAFVGSLKESYDAWMGSADESPAKRERDAKLAALKTPLGELTRFDRLMTQPAEGTNESLVRLIRRSIELGEHRAELAPVERERLPKHGDFAHHRPAIEHLAKVLQALGEEPVLARHPFRLLNDRVLGSERPIELVSQAVTALLPTVESLLGSPSATAKNGTALVLAATFERAALAARVRPLAKAGLLALLDESQDLYRQFRSKLSLIADKGAALAKAVAAAAGWRTPIGRADLAAVLELARRWNHKLLRFLFPSFWRLRRIVRERFDFHSTLVPPSYVDVVGQLQAKYDAEDSLATAKLEVAKELGIDDLDTTQGVVEDIHSRRAWTPAERELRTELLTPGAGQWADELAALAPEVEHLRGNLEAVFDGYQSLTLSGLRDELRGIQRRVDALAELVRVLRELRSMPSVAAALRDLPLAPGAFEWAVCDKTIGETLRANPTVASLNGRSLGLMHEQLETAHSAWRKANAAYVLERTRAAFLANVRRATAPAAGLPKEEQAFKKDYSAGRRDLEHEMGKVMRFKAIRELMTGKTGLVIRDLKPVWLMSPLSVADTIPLSSEYFDVVIFDEASQIPLEDAIPAIHRAEQCIVVGDEMQLPPTNFFGAAQDEDELAVTFQERDATVSYELDADSLLAHAARTLPSTMLGWHYRSRDESLIQFSNQAFYDGKLATVPTPQMLAPRAPIRASTAAQGADGARLLLERSVSYHRLEGAIYEARTNRLEADYIAEMVRALLAKDTRQSIGIVAFSEAQQGEIENALARLAEKDADFRAQLDAEYERTEDDQFCGLFVKNLENVQGDERDVIILSICYGPDGQAKMRMNFGPINKRGGEKRLNVIFSRARRHLAVVSSIDDTHITNDYNDGANTLRCYLRYSAALSQGDEVAARAALRAVSRGSDERASAASEDAAARAIAAALRARGWRVSEAVGGSRFRCDLAVRGEDDAEHRVAVLVDTDAHYEAGDTDERYRVKPALLRAFNWRVQTVLAKDWRDSPSETLARIEESLKAARGL
jgi:hypothetical protein